MLMYDSFLHLEIEFMRTRMICANCIKKSDISNNRTHFSSIQREKNCWYHRVCMPRKLALTSPDASSWPAIKCLRKTPSSATIIVAISIDFLCSRK